MAEIRLLGPVEVVDDDGQVVPLGGPKERCVLAALAIHANRVVSEDRLTDAVWGEDPPRTATKTLQAYVSRLRRTLPESIVIESVPGGYRLVASDGAFDVAVVEATLVSAREAVARGEPVVAAELLSEGLRRWRGEPLAEVANEPFAVAEASRLRELHLVALEERVEADLAAGRHAQVAAELESLTATYPLRERLWSQRILALYRCGRQADALRVYQDVRNLLGEELGIEPGVELRALEAAVLAQSPELDWDSPRQPAATPTAAALPSGVVTFVLTDVVGSTRLWEADAAAMDAALVRHDEILRTSTEANRGVLLKHRGEGDSTFAVFTRATDATLAALAARRTLEAEAWPTAEPICVRIAVHTGEAVERDGDYFGPTVNRVARLRALAEAGQILVSQSTAEVVADHLPPEALLVELGDKELRDLTRPIRVFELVGAGTGAAAAPPRPAPATPRPSGAAGRPASPLVPPEVADVGPPVSRERELEALQGAWEAAVEGGRRAVLLGGEPGVGKTTLAAAAARHAAAEGALVLFGRCDEDLVLPYQPFVEALRHLVGEMAAEVLEGVDRRALGDLLPLFPELAERVAGLQRHEPGDADEARYALFEGVAALLAATGRPVLLVLDDLHWANKPTLLLLRHLLRARVVERLLVVGTYRDTELDRAHPLAEALAELARAGAAERMAVRGLDGDGVLALVAAATGQDVSDLDDHARRFAATLHQETAGNPFFVREVLAHLADAGTIGPGRPPTADAGASGVPEAVRDVVGRRLARLSEAANRALAVAAVTGAGFELELLEHVPDAAVDPDSLLDALDECVGARLVDEVPSAPGSYRFSHALVRETLLQSLTSARRARLHRRIADALVRLDPSGRRYLAALAHHHAESARAGDTAAAVEWCLRAAADAMRTTAPEQALTHAERARQVLELEDQPDARSVAHVELALGQALSAMGAMEDMRGHASRAAAAARATGDADLLAQAALLRSWGNLIGEPTPDETRALHREALDALEERGSGDPGLRALLLMRGGRPTHAGNELESAVELARQASDRSILARVLNDYSYVLTAGPDLARAIAVADEVVAMAVEEAVADPRTGGAGLGYLARAEARLALGDLDGFDADSREVAARTSRRSAYFDYREPVHHGVRALLRGDWPAAQDAIGRLSESVAAGSAPAGTFLVAQRLVLHRERGEMDAVEPLVDAALSVLPDLHVLRLVRLAVLAEAGRVEEAAAGVDQLRGQGVAALAGMWRVSVPLLAEVAGRTGDAALAAEALELARPYAGQLAVAPQAAAVVGAVDRGLGILAATAGRYDEAEQWFTSALALEERLGARPHVARTRLWFARMLRDRGGSGDAERSIAMAREAGQLAEALEMRSVAAEARSLSRSLPPALAATAPLSGRDEALAQIVAAWDEARSGAARVVVIGGEPGVGKTRLAAEVARRALADGGAVLFGRCDEGLSVPYQPFAEALRAHFGDASDADVAGLERTTLRDLSRLLPELRERMPDLEPPISVDAETDRYALFEAVADAIGHASGAAPLVLVLDDLHWAAKPTLQMLRHLARAGGGRLLVLGTYRDTELDRTHPLAETLADLRRDEHVRRVALRGLDVVGVTAMVRAAAGHDLDERAADLAAALHRETGGNPFFVREVLAHLVESGLVYQEAGRWTSDRSVADLGLPEGVREVVGRRLARLDDDTNRVLTVAAVLGQEFDAHVVQAALEGDDIVLDALDAAVTAGLVSEAGGAPGVYRFAHALIRQTLYAELSSARKVRLHGAVAQALEQLPRSRRNVATLAHHFAESAAAGNAAKAVQYAREAAEQVSLQYAFDEAVAHLEHALHVLEMTDDVDVEQRCRVLLDLSRALGSIPDLAGREVAFRAAEDARRIGSTELLAQAARLASFALAFQPDPESVALLEEAIAAVGDADPGLRARLLLTLAFRLRFSDVERSDRATRLLREAIQLVRPFGVDFFVAGEDTAHDALGMEGAIIWDDAHVPESTEIVDACVARAEARGDRFLGRQARARNERALSRLERGDRAGFEEDVAAFAALAERMRSPNRKTIVAMWRGMRAVLDGRFDEVAPIADQLAETAQLDPGFLQAAVGLHVQVARERGRLDEVDALLQAILAELPIPAMKAGLAAVAAERGDAGAQAAFDAMFDDEGALLPRDEIWTSGMLWLAEAAARLGDAARAAWLLEALLPYSGRMVVGPNAVSCLGAVDRALGILATTLGRFADAERWFAAAVEQERRLGSPPNVARSLAWFGRMLRARGGPGDAERAVAVAAESLAIAEALGMAGVAAEARAIARPLPAALATPTPLSGRDEPLETALAAWHEVRTGSSGVVLVAGEPGIGKTRLAAEVARIAFEDGARVLFGRCDEDLAVPYQPFVEALRAFFDAAPDDALAAFEPATLRDLAGLLPELRDRVPGLGQSIAAEAEAERYALFEAVIDATRHAATAAPLVLVLDDLHWAGKPTLLMLRHVVRALPPHVLVVGTYRDTELDRSHPLAEALADLRRGDNARRIALRGLDVAGISSLLADAAGHDLDDRAKELAVALHDETGGNPFFVREVLAHLVETGTLYQADGRWTSDLDVAQLGLPEGVREVITRRLTRLSDEVNRTLTVAAVHGHEFSVDLLERVPDAGEPDEVLDALDAAAAAGLIEELPKPAGAYRFAHALIRQTLYGELSSARRVRLHRRLGEALESLPAAGGAHLAALARHFGEGARAGDVAKAVDYARKAAERAMSQFAFEEAAEHLERALQVLELDDEPDVELRCHVLLGLAAARSSTFEADAMQQAALQAAEDARRLGSAELLARAAQLYASWSVAWTPNPTAMALLDEALVAVGDDPALRAQLLFTLAFRLRFSDVERSDRWHTAVTEAWALASSLTPDVLVEAALQWGGASVWDGLSAVDDIAASNRMIEELVALAAEPGNRFALQHVQGRFVRAKSRLQRGDMAGFEEDAAEFEALARQLRSWYRLGNVAIWRGMRALLAGRFDEVEEAAAEVATRGSHDLSFVAAAAALQLQLALEQGDLEAAEAIFVFGLEGLPSLRAFAAGLTMVAAERGDVDAQERLDAMFDDEGELLYSDDAWIVGMLWLTEAACRLRDRDRAAFLLDRLRPQTGRLVVGPVGVACLGAADRLLAMNASVLGHFDDAERWFESAVALEERVGSPPQAAKSRLWYARMLLDRDGPGDCERERALLESVLEVARPLGMQGLVREAEGLLAT